MVDPVAHARNYPFPVPGKSYIFRNGDVTAYCDDEIDKTLRTPVLAAGSNQSNEQLARKYSVFRGDVEIPIQRATVANFDTVYAAHIAAYGSIPSTFYPSPGTEVTTYVLWLDDAQLNRMHETEGNYTFDQLDSIQVNFGNRTQCLKRAYVYTARVGCVNINGLPVALKEISARKRTLPEMTQTEMLESLRLRLSSKQNLDTFIRSHIDSAEVRAERSFALSEDAIQLNFQRKTLGKY